MPRLKKFSDFIDARFPSEIAYVETHNAYEDEELKSILEIAAARVGLKSEAKTFDPSIDPRKYSKLMKSFDKKLSEIDVDKYFEWISHINHLITIDSIPPKEQSKILKEMQIFQPGWFHMESFYRLIQNYEGYLLRRFRESDYTKVKSFLNEHRQMFNDQKEIEHKVSEITEVIVFGKSGGISKANIEWLLEIYRDESLSQKIRYNSLLAFMMHHIDKKETGPLVRPMQELEDAIFDGQFYSRRILANFYANKLIVLHWQKAYEEAAYCGLQSIKHKTEDYLYYLNNYVSVLLHLGNTNEALKKMQEMFPWYKSARDMGRKVVFITNYCRCLNLEHRFAKSASLARSFLDEHAKQLFQFRWHYFFRTYLLALIKCDQTELIIRLNRKFKLLDREVKEAFDPHIRALLLAAEYREIKLSQNEFFAGIEELNEAKGKGESEFYQLLEMVKGDFSEK